MTGGNGKHIHRLGDKMFCTREEAEEIAHASYVLATKDAATRSVALVKAFEARIAGLESRIEALEPQSAATVSPT